MTKGKPIKTQQKGDSMTLANSKATDQQPYIEQNIHLVDGIGRDVGKVVIEEVSQEEVKQLVDKMINERKTYNSRNEVMALLNEFKADGVPVNVVFDDVALNFTAVIHNWKFTCSYTNNDSVKFINNLRIQIGQEIAKYKVYLENQGNGIDPIAFRQVVAERDSMAERMAAMEAKLALLVGN
jgi:hypothetical protein